MDHQELIRSIGAGRMGRDQIQACLTELAKRLVVKGERVKIVLVGGAALSLFYDRPQGTVDIDAAAQPTDVVIDEVRGMALEFGLREDWFNQAAVGYIPHELTTVEVIEDGPVTIEAADAEILLAMKLRASRPSKDQWDLAWLLRRCDIRSIDEAQAHMDRIYDGEEELSKRGRLLVAALLKEVEMPTAPPTTLPAMAPRAPKGRCPQWMVKKDRFCQQESGHHGDHT